MLAHARGKSATSPKNCILRAKIPGGPPRQRRDVGDLARAREFETGRIPVNLTANVSASLQARADLGLLFPTYTFATPVFGGQLTLGAAGVYGRESTSLAGTVSAALATPLGTFPFSRFDNISESVWGFGDLLPMATLRRSQLHDIHHRKHTDRSL